MKILWIAMPLLSISLYEGCPENDDDDATSSPETTDIPEETPDITPDFTPDVTPTEETPEETPEVTPFPDISASVYTTHIPSDATGDIGIAIRVFYPSTSERRYSLGSPIAVAVPGGWGAGALTDSTTNSNVSKYGYIQIEYLMPGGTDNDGTVSGGTFDYRGENSLKATQNVIKYAAGMVKDSEGLTILDRIPFALTDHVGLWANSNGGNTSQMSLLESEEILPVSWVLTWESPIGDQYGVGELNNNPYYVPGTCSVTTCPWSGIEGSLRFDPKATTTVKDWNNVSLNLTGGLFLDSNANGKYESNLGERLFTPVVGNGAGNGATSGQSKWYFSTEMSQTIQSYYSTVFGVATYPSWLGTAEETTAFWPLRDISSNFLELDSLYPNLLVIHLSSQDDHVQEQPDYPHSRSHIQGWLDADHLFVRLNPDSEYLALVTNLSESYFVDNDANTSVPWPDTINYMEPEKVENVSIDRFLEQAGLIELMDRTEYQNFSNNLTEVIYE